MEHQIYSIFDKDLFCNLTSGLKVVQSVKGDENFNVETEKTDHVTKQFENILVSDALFCSFCNVGFADKEQQRLHYKLDWHRYNLKQNLIGRKLVNEEEFQNLADDLSSISGSESESDGSEDEEKSAKSDEALEKCKLKTDSTAQRTQAGRHCKFFFENSEGKIISVYRCILYDKKVVPENDGEIIKIFLDSVDKVNWAVIMLGGGHFAAAIFNGREVVLHKTFHSYTVRARQGGSQSSKDNRSVGSHPKSAGASLRRYNEASFNQHVQDIFTEWSEQLKDCSLIIYRAVGHNQAILFGGRNPPLSRTDSRLRTVPFSTRRATFNEVKRVHSILSSLEVYGSVEKFQSLFSISPKKNKSTLSTSQNDEIKKCDSSVENAISKIEDEYSAIKEEARSLRSQQPKRSMNRSRSRPSPCRPLPEIVTEILEQTSSEDSNDDEAGVQWTVEEKETTFQHDLQEYGDTVQQKIKDMKKKKKKRSKPVKKKPASSDDQDEKCKGPVTILREKLIAACNLGNTVLLQDCLKSVRVATPTDSEGRGENDVNSITPCDFQKCLNDKVLNNGATLLHIAAENGNIEMLRCLLEAGCDPSVKNKKAQPPFAVSADRETRNAFRKFMGDFPEKYDYKKSQIPGPLTDEMEREIAERQKELKKAKRVRERERKKEETDKDRFLKLSDREKRALAAERRILESNAKGRSNINIVARCFECAADITGKVPFEYDIHRFCTIECLKRHRQKVKLDQK